MRSALFLTGLVFCVGVQAQETLLQVKTSSLHVISTERQGGQSGQPVEKRGRGVDSGQVNTDKGPHAAKQAASSQQRKGEIARNDNPDFWIYDVFVTYQEDDDVDGYFSRFSVELDADTAFAAADVYARLFLSRGDVYEEYHTTSVFTIYGDSSEDSLVVDSQLLSGFPSGDYDMLIELYDTFNDSLVAIFDGFNDADLTLLTLESKNFETAQATVVITEESGGSFGYLMILLIPLFLRRIVQ